MSACCKNLEGKENKIHKIQDSHLRVGLIPLDDLGLETDLQNQRLRVLPMEGKDTYLMIL